MLKMITWMDGKSCVSLFAGQSLPGASLLDASLQHSDNEYINMLIILHFRFSFIVIHLKLGLPFI